MHVTLFEDTVKNAKVGKRPKRGTKSSIFGASFFVPFFELQSPKMVLSLFVVVVVLTLPMHATVFLYSCHLFICLLLSFCFYQILYPLIYIYIFVFSFTIARQSRRILDEVYNAKPIVFIQCFLGRSWEHHHPLSDGLLSEQCLWTSGVLLNWIRRIAVRQSF